MSVTNDLLLSNLMYPEVVLKVLTDVAEANNLSDDAGLMNVIDLAVERSAAHDGSGAYEASAEFYRILNARKHDRRRAGG